MQRRPLDPDLAATVRTLLTEAWPPDDPATLRRWWSLLGKQVGLRVALTSCEAVATAVLDQQGALDVVINNAGSHLLGAAMETSHAELCGQLELNLMGAVNLTSAALPHLVARRSGRIVNLSSVGGRFATPFTAAYAASKFALEGYMEALRLELVPLDVYVTNLEPAFLATGTTDASIHPVGGTHPLFTAARATAYARMLRDGPNGLPLSKVAYAVEAVIQNPAPPLRLSVDGFATKLALARALTPSWLFERMVLRQTAPKLMGR
jgi:NAD(P)-dependent dehydrogenase (short-subunit alcohol dehydrogenase family)